MAIRLTRAAAKAMGVDVTPKAGSRKKCRERKAAERRTGEALMERRCKAHGLPIPIAEYRFHRSRKWRLDWVFEGLVALEICGGVYVRAGTTAGGGTSSTIGRSGTRPK